MPYYNNGSTWWPNSWATTSSTTCDYTWWTWSTTTTAATQTIDVYSTWITQTMPSITIENLSFQTCRPRPQSAEAFARTAERARVREEARTRAEALLLESLTAVQRADYEEHRRFDVHTRSGRRYRIQCGRQHNVHQLDGDGLAVVNLCGHIGDAVPNEDNILAQKLMLEHDEDAFLALANASHYAQPTAIA